MSVLMRRGERALRPALVAVPDAEPVAPDLPADTRADPPSAR
ncbi:MAG TPA: hypothetical protein VGH89_13390 [Pseudonocardia sp.]